MRILSFQLSAGVLLRRRRSRRGRRGRSPSTTRPWSRSSPCCCSGRRRTAPCTCSSCRWAARPAWPRAKPGAGPWYPALAAGVGAGVAVAAAVVVVLLDLGVDPHPREVGAELAVVLDLRAQPAHSCGLYFLSSDVAKSWPASAQRMRSQLVKVSTSAPAVPVPVPSVLRPVLIRIGVYRFFVSTSGSSSSSSPAAWCSGVEARRFRPLGRHLVDAAGCGDVGVVAAELKVAARRHTTSGSEAGVRVVCCRTDWRQGSRARAETGSGFRGGRARARGRTRGQGRRTWPCSVLRSSWYGRSADGATSVKRRKTDAVPSRSVTACFWLIVFE